MQHIHIPYRNCKLTMLLKECFEPGEGGGRAASVFVSHLSPLHSSVGHTLNTLDYTVAMIEATRAEQERAKATTTSAVQKLEVAEKQVRMAMAARDGLLRFCHFILHLIVCRLLFDFRECVFVVAYRGNTRMLRVLLSGSAGWRGEATGRHAETT